MLGGANQKVANITDDQDPSIPIRHTPDFTVIITLREILRDIGILKLGQRAAITAPLSTGLWGLKTEPFKKRCKIGHGAVAKMPMHYSL